MLVRHNLRQLGKHVVCHREHLQQRLSGCRGHDCGNERRHRVRVQLGAVDIVDCDPLGKSEELAHLPR